MDVLQKQSVGGTEPIADLSGIYSAFHPRVSRVN